MSLALVNLACGDETATETTAAAEVGETTTTTDAPKVVETPTTTDAPEVVETTTTTIGGLAAVAPEGFPLLELPTDALLIASDPPAGQVGTAATAFYDHEADVMEEFPIWRQRLKDAGFEFDRNQAWTSGAAAGYILIGTTADTAFDIVILGGDARSIGNNPFYDLPPDSIPEEFEMGFVLVLTANEAE
jgi:hypothetical protein